VRRLNRTRARSRFGDTVSDGPAERPVGVARVMVRRNFLPFFLGNLFSNSGTWFQTIAQVLLVYRLTGSPFLVGVVNFSQFAAVIFLAPVSGAAADRFDRRKLVLYMQMLAVALAALLAVLTAAGSATTGIVIGVALALGVTTAMTIPALQAIVPMLVNRSELSAAVALTAVTFNLSRVLGPILGVAVIANFSIATAFAVNSLSYLALVAGLLLVSPREDGRKTPASPPRLRTSLRLVTSDRRLLAPLIVVGLVGIMSDPVNTLTPAFSTQVFGRPDTFTGFLVGAFGAGAVTAAFVVTGRAHPSYRLISLTLGVMSLGMVTFALSASEAVGLLGLFVCGFGYVATVVAATSLLHLATDESHRGRIMSLWSLAFQGSRPIGSLVDGAVASLAGIRIAGLFMALPGLVGGIGLAVLLARDAPKSSAEKSTRAR
jgi:MFS family permease